MGRTQRPAGSQSFIDQLRRVFSPAQRDPTLFPGPAQTPGRPPPPAPYDGPIPVAFPASGMPARVAPSSLADPNADPGTVGDPTNAPTVRKNVTGTQVLGVDGPVFTPTSGKSWLVEWIVLDNVYAAQIFVAPAGLIDTASLQADPTFWRGTLDPTDVQDIDQYQLTPPLLVPNGSALYVAFASTGCQVIQVLEYASATS